MLTQVKKYFVVSVTILAFVYIGWIEYSESSDIKVAACQIYPKILDLKGNLEKHIQFIKQAADNGAKLIVFPEMSMTGYYYSSWSEVAVHGQYIPGPITDSLSKVCKASDVYVVIGMIEKDGLGGDWRYYNASVLIGPTGVLGKYRKTHLPYMGADRFVKKGDLPYRVIDTPIGKIGLGICYDLRFPEQWRTLALKGAEILINSTNVYREAEVHKNLMGPTRALENRIFLITCNRIGPERGGDFLGLSNIIDVNGKILAEAGRDKEEIIYATIDPTIAKEKYLVFKPGEIELDLFKDRRPDLYEVEDKKK